MRFVDRLKWALGGSVRPEDEDEAMAMERRFFGSFTPTLLPEVEAQQAPRLQPDNPLGSVYDLHSALTFVKMYYPPYQRAYNLLPSGDAQYVETGLALTFAVIVEHVVLTERDPETGNRPSPRRLDEFLYQYDEDEIVSVLHTSPARHVPKHLQETTRGAGMDEGSIRWAFAQIRRHYGGRWGMTA